MEPRIIDTGGEFPSRQQLTGLGELCFLFLRAPTVARMPVVLLRRSLEPAIDTGQFAVMRQNGVPRACVTWACLSEDAEERLLRGQRLSTEDWMSGDRMWLMDLVAPYGQGSARRMLRFFEESLTPAVQEVRFQRPGRHAGEIRTYLSRRGPTGRFTTVDRNVLQKSVNKST